MSRLDAFIRRMQAQRACIDAVAATLHGQAGPVLELGLGNGRTYDHLRIRFPDRAIFVFDREVAVHPDCIPPERFLRLGDFRASIPAYLAEGQPSAAFIHADIGDSNMEASVRLAADLAPTLLKILGRGGYLACDQPIVLGGLERLALPDGLDDGRYHFCRRLD
jgi:hypothetical protein